MSTAAKVSSRNREASEKKKVKKKMSKAQIQQAIIKKKQCDAKALTIVEQLLEPNVNPQWLLSSLGYINKSHMEDVIEERAITKLCGYVLCDKALTVIIRQQYHISTKQNKVYDVSKRKNFCSSKCYGACNYLLEQMLSSPLWLRENEEIPVFRLLPAKEVSERSVPGDEICVRGSDPLIHSDNENHNINLEKEEASNEANNKSSDSCIPEQSGGMEKDQREASNDNANAALEKLLSADIKDDEKTVAEATASSKNQRNKPKKCVTFSTNLEETFTSGHNLQLVYREVEDVKESCEPDCLLDDMNQDLEEDDVEFSNIEDNETHDTKAKSRQTKPDITSDKKREKNNHNKCKKDKQEFHSKSETCEFFNLAVHIEKNMKEWFTEDTIRLLSGDEDTKRRLLENILQHDKYLQLCKKLNKLQLEDEKNDQADLVKRNRKPLPHFSVLEEEGKKMELKVRAFFQGKMVVDEPNVTQETDEKNEDSLPVIPLTDAHAPKAIRRRIFLDKLHKILPDLLRALANNKPQSFALSEKSMIIKALVNSFALSATNIIFKTAEWTLVGLIIIKMLSILDPQMKALLATKQAAMYTSMILMSYKLDPNYLDRLVIELTNNPKIFDLNCDASV